VANKKITDLQLRDNVTADVNLPGDDGLQTYRVTAQQLKDFVRPMPVGALVPYAGSSAPTGFLLCDGSAVSRSTYADLFAAIATNFGVGDGSTTFNLPDLRGRVVAGKDDMGGSGANRLTTAGSAVDGLTLGASGGAQNITLTSAQMPSHTHVQDAHTHTQNAHGHNLPSYPSAGGSNVWGLQFWSANRTLTVDYAQNATQATTATNQNTTATNQNTGGGGAHSNVQPTLIMNYLIKH
jgi:microcystin-dependent protein